MIADHAQRGSDRNGQNQSHAAPHPAPEEQRDSDGHGIQAHAASHQLGRQQINRQNVDSGQRRRNQRELRKRSPLRQRNDKRGQPGQHRPDVRHHVQESRRDARKDGILHADDPEE